MNIRKTSAMAAALSALLLFAVSGCGDDETTSSTTALTKQEFLDQGNAICDAGNKDIDAEAQDIFSGGKQPSSDELEQFATGTLIPSVQGQIDDLRALGAPEGDEEQVSQILDSAESDLSDLKSDPSLIASGDPFAETNQELKAYGLTTCAGG